MLILPESAINNPKKYMWFASIVAVLMILLVAVPSLAPSKVGFLHPLRIDTDPENMLDSHEPVRVFHNKMKADFSLYDMVVVGVVNRENKQGVFNAKSLADVYELGEYAKTLQWKDKKGEEVGVIGIDVIAPSNVDNIIQAGLGSVSFEWLMSAPPKDDREALEIAERAKRIPLLNETLVSGDGKAIALYVPITSKSVSFDVAEKLKEKIATFSKDNGDEWYITGLPVAQDQFGSEMFKQMAVSAPMAMLFIFVLMWYFFRNVRIIISPMIVAMISVIFTMGLLVATGNTVHIMSSMIPIFIMPIAVLDAVHILSDFFDNYQKTHDRRKTLQHVMEELSSPMLFTTLTTCAGFGSLAFTPIPPVQVFGIFVAIGVFFAWILTVTLVPAYIMLMPEKSLEGFGMKIAGEGDNAGGEEEHYSPLARFLFALGKVTYSRPYVFLGLTVLALGVSAYGITLIRINDNPVRWFKESHEIRIADKALNERFAGTYMAYLAFAAEDEDEGIDSYVEKLKKQLGKSGNVFAGEMADELPKLVEGAADKKELLEKAKAFAEERADLAESDDDWEAWGDIASMFGEEMQLSEVFKRPDVLNYISGLQEYLLKSGLVGKSNSLADVVKTVHRDLFLGDEKEFRIPESSAGVAQTLMTYQNSHRPQDLWHFVTPDYRTTNMWIQMKSGDNVDTRKVVDVVDDYIRDNPPPVKLSHDWFGLTYINIVWQEKMVSGMVSAFLGSFVIVVILVIVLFRSFWWGMLCMVPLTVTIAFIYGLIGLVGKDYDMPVAVLSSLSLGLSVDYAIHFLARSREMREQFSSWKETVQAVFGEPARAIARNVAVIGIGFTPLLAAPLVPYQTVGFLISSILVMAGLATLVILPSLIRVMERLLFKKKGVRQ